MGRLEQQLHELDCRVAAQDQEERRLQVCVPVQLPLSW